MLRVYIRVFILFSLSLIFLSSCDNLRSQKKNINNNNKIHIVTTTTILKDLIENIGKDKVEVLSLMGEGVDPHLYKASAGDIKKLNDAQLIVFGGLHLEGKMGDVFENLRKQNKDVLNLGDILPKDKLILVDENLFDPHVWFSTELFGMQANFVADKLISLDSSNKNYYQNNLNQYQNQLKDLTSYSIEKLNLIDKDKRFLITAHDAFSYFARQFNFKVLSIQGVSTDSEASTKNIADLADFISQNKIKSIFVESSTPQKTIKSLQEAVRSRGYGVQIGGELYSDSLGGLENNSETYIKTFKSNIDTIVDALK